MEHIFYVLLLLATGVFVIWLGLAINKWMDEPPEFLGPVDLNSPDGRPMDPFSKMLSGDPDLQVQGFIEFEMTRWLLGDRDWP